MNLPRIDATELATRPRSLGACRAAAVPLALRLTGFAGITVLSWTLDSPAFRLAPTWALWGTAAMIAGADLRRGATEPRAARGEREFAIQLRSIGVRSLPAAFLLSVAAAFGAMTGVTAAVAFAQVVALAAVGVMLGHRIARAGILYVALFGVLQLMSIASWPVTSEPSPDDDFRRLVSAGLLFVPAVSLDLYTLAGRRPRLEPRP